MNGARIIDAVVRKGRPSGYLSYISPKTASNSSFGLANASADIKRCLRGSMLSYSAKLLDLRFLKNDMLPDHGIIFIQFKFAGLRPRILFCHIKKARVCRRNQFDLNYVTFCHDNAPLGRRLAENNVAVNNLPRAPNCPLQQGCDLGLVFQCGKRTFDRMIHSLSLIFLVSHSDT